MNGVGDFLRGVTRQREGVEGEQVRVFDAGQSAESRGERCDFFVADERAVKA